MELMGESEFMASQAKASDIPLPRLWEPGKQSLGRILPLLIGMILDADMALREIWMTAL